MSVPHARALRCAIGGIAAASIGAMAPRIGEPVDLRLRRRATTELIGSFRQAR